MGRKDNNPVVAYPPAITSGFMGVPAPPTSKMIFKNANEYFQNVRNEQMSRLQSKHYEWGAMEREYVAHSDIGMLNKINNMDKFIKMPPSKFTMLDVGRQQEIDAFYMACQRHRDQCKDQNGRLHPLDYFKATDYKYQCATDPTTKYLKSPLFYVKYKTPQVLPLTLERTYRTPLLPERALTGRYNNSSDITYKR